MTHHEPPHGAGQVHRPGRRRILAAGAVALATTALSRRAGAADPAWPQKPIRIVVPLPPGTTPDIVARTVAPRVAADLGQPVLVDNRSGASGHLASEQVARSAPDGTTLLLAGLTQSSQPAIRGEQAIDPTKAFVAVVKLTSQPILVAAHPSLGIASLPALVARAKREPGKLAYSTGGIGSAGHLTAILLSQRAGIELLHVPYPSANLVMKDLLSGEVPLTFNTLSAGIPHLRDGRIAGLGISDSHRSPEFPALPTIAEQGYPGFEVTSFTGILAPVGTPADVVERLNRSFAAALAAADVREKLVGAGMDVVGGPARDFDAELRADVARWKSSLKDAGIRIE